MKTLRKNSNGNQRKLHEVGQKKRKRDASVYSVIEQRINENDERNIGSSLFALGRCCKKSDDNGCIMKMLRTAGALDINRAVSYVRECRKLSETKDACERGRFIMTQFKESMIMSTDMKTPKLTSKGYIKHTFHLGPEKIKICKKSYLLGMGFTEHEFRECDKLYKENPEVDTFIKPTKFTDSYAHDYTFAQSRQVFRDNVLQSSASTHLENNLCGKSCHLD